MVRAPEQVYWLTLAYGCRLELKRAKAIAVSWCLDKGFPLTDLFRLPAAELAAQMDLSGPESACIVDSAASLAQFNAWHTELTAAGIQVITRADARYPAALSRCRPTPAQPMLLFCRGNLDLLDSCSIAVIGPPQADQAMLDGCRMAAAVLAAEEVVAWSGMGRGIGQAIADEVLAAGGRLALLLPTGINRSNGGPGFKSGLDRGQVLWVSPFHPDAPFQDMHARSRNRLMAEMSTAILVMGEDAMGLSRDTADAAFRLGKGVYVWELDPDGRPLIDAGGLPVAGLDDLVDMVETTREIYQLGKQAGGDPVAGLLPETDRSRSTGVAPGPAPEPDPDPQATLDLLARAGTIPDVLKERLMRANGE